MQTFRSLSKDKKIILLTTIILGIGLTGYAAIPVVDYSNIAEAVKIVEQATKQVEKLNEQIGIAKAQLAEAKKSLTDFPKEAFGNLKKMTNEADKIVIDTVKKHTSGFLKGIKGKDINIETKKMLKEMFATSSSENINPSKVDSMTADVLNSKTSANIEKFNEEALAEINALEVSINKDYEQLLQLQDANQKAVGLKDTLQIANQVKIVTADIERKQARIKNLQAKQQLLLDEEERKKSENNRLAEINASVENQKKMKKPNFKPNYSFTKGFTDTLKKKANNW